MMQAKSQYVFLMSLLCLIDLGLAGQCGPAVNPITDVSWQCVFPIRIGGLIQQNVSGNGLDEDPDTISNPVCACGGTVGVTMSFWEPARMIDTVSDPFCFGAIGRQLSNPQPGQLAGGLTRAEGGSRAFQQMHYYVFPVWAILDLFVDLPCTDKKEFDIAMISEVLPHWNNEVLALLLNPEAVLFGHPATQMACAADAVAATAGLPINELFWCQGAWPSVYPLAGSITATDYVEANAAIAGRSIFMMGRLGALMDPGVSECGVVPTPIWRKRNTRLQLAKPVKSSSCLLIGRPGLTWTANKNPPMAGDNFSWMMFRKVKCCVGY
jgi:conjugal transfer pilus assembly protein TraU